MPKAKVALSTMNLGGRWAQRRERMIDFSMLAFLAAGVLLTLVWVGYLGWHAARVAYYTVSLVISGD